MYTKLIENNSRLKSEVGCGVGSDDYTTEQHFMNMNDDFSQSINTFHAGNDAAVCFLLSHLVLLFCFLMLVHITLKSQIFRFTTIHQCICILLRPLSILYCIYSFQRLEVIYIQKHLYLTRAIMFFIDTIRKSREPGSLCP